MEISPSFLPLLLILATVPDEMEKSERDEEGVREGRREIKKEGILSANEQRSYSLTLQ